MQLSLHIAANGHCCLEFGDHDSKLGEEISRHLDAVVGFGRVSDAVAELDEGIHQLFECGWLLIFGWLEQLVRRLFAVHIIGLR